jgi:hypothetical protein
MSPQLTKEQTEILIYAARRGPDGLFAIHRGTHVTLSISGDAGMQFVRSVANNQAAYIAALEDLVEYDYMQLVEDARPEGGNELKYIITPKGRARVAKPEMPGAPASRT